MTEVHILDIKLIGAGIVFIAFALIVVLGYALGPYLEIISPSINEKIRGGGRLIY